jgi:hypothetical protein
MELSWLTGKLARKWRTALLAKKRKSVLTRNRTFECLRIMLLRPGLVKTVLLDGVASDGLTLTSYDRNHDNVAALLIKDCQNNAKCNQRFSSLNLGSLDVGGIDKSDLSQLIPAIYRGATDGKSESHCLRF